MAIPRPAAIPDDKSLLDRMLSVFTDVRAGEGLSALLLAANVFYLLAFYQVLKIVRDALILSESGAVAASYGNAIYVAPFVGDPADDELLQLARYVVTLRDLPDVRRVEKRGWRQPAARE